MEQGICMACGWKRKLGVQRAHITPRVHGGADSVENLHMLCHDCHTASEYVEGAAYWQWFYSTNQETALLAWALRSGNLTLDQMHRWLKHKRRPGATAEKQASDQQDFGFWPQPRG
jgi:hypothetical protein